MGEHKNNPQVLAEILEKVAFYDLTATDGCLCAHIRLRRIDIDVHCWKSPCNDGCRWASIHLTPLEPENKDDLLKIGEMVRAEMNRPDMNVRIIIHEPTNSWNYADSKHPNLVFDAPTPGDGFQFGYPGDSISPTSPCQC